MEKFIKFIKKSLRYGLSPELLRGHACVSLNPLYLRSATEVTGSLRSSSPSSLYSASRASSYTLGVGSKDQTTRWHRGAQCRICDSVRTHLK